MENITQKEISRRELLKTLAAASGAVVAASMLPSQWVSPVVDAGVLPAHAQGSKTYTLTFHQLVTGYNFRVNGDGEGTVNQEYTMTNQTKGSVYLLEYRYVGAAGQGTRARFEYKVDGGNYMPIEAANAQNTDNSGNWGVYANFTFN